MENVNASVINNVMDPNMIYAYFRTIIAPEIIGKECSFEDGDNLRMEYNGQAGKDDLTILDYISVFFGGETVEEWETFVANFCKNGTLPNIEANPVYASGAYQELARRTDNDEWNAVADKFFEAGNRLEIAKRELSHLQWELSNI